jgi:methylthioribose-1-phosphate isomerase
MPILSKAPDRSARPQPSIFQSVRWDQDAPVIIDQRRLPEQLTYWKLESVDTVVEAIRTLAVRGAPAIGITAGYGMVLGLDEAAPETLEDARRTLDDLVARIGDARPTAVNLRGAVERVRRAASAAADPASLRDAALAEAYAIHAEDQASCAEIGTNGRAELAGKRRLLTHCNTGRLATGGDGTALGVIYAKHAAGDLDEVLITEARPLLQGGRLTAWELGASGVPNRLMVDGAAALAMARGLVDAVIVGCDRVAANGDTANKIGTYGLAVLARRHGLPFYVAGPLSSFDPRTPTGGEIVIEERAADEVRAFGGLAVAPGMTGVWNPAFDVTPADLIDAFITDVGVLRPPYPESIAAATGLPA